MQFQQSRLFSQSALRSCLTNLQQLLSQSLLITFASNTRNYNNLYYVIQILTADFGRMTVIEKNSVASSIKIFHIIKLALIILFVSLSFKYKGEPKPIFVSDAVIYTINIIHNKIWDLYVQPPIGSWNELWIQSFNWSMAKFSESCTIQCWILGRHISSNPWKKR